MAGLMREGSVLREILETFAILLAGLAAVAYFFAANVVTHAVAGRNEAAERWLFGLFLANFLQFVLWCWFVLNVGQ